MDIDDLMSKSSDYYRFHGVRRATLERLVAQAEGEFRLWGRTDDGYQYGAGEISVTCWDNVEMSCNEFVDDGGLVLVMESSVDTPAEEDHPTDKREHLLRAEEWRVIGGLRPIFDEDEDLVDFEALSLDEIREEYE